MDLHLAKPAGSSFRERSTTGSSPAHASNATTARPPKVKNPPVPLSVLTCLAEGTRHVLFLSAFWQVERNRIEPVSKQNRTRIEPESNQKRSRTVGKPIFISHWRSPYENGIVINPISRVRMGVLQVCSLYSQAEILIDFFSQFHDATLYRPAGPSIL